ncbi:MAG: DUF1570 domain-containing protein [Planctomycetes bacterium]|nr:DUF1570 domain-containing protein [Planctomycetota bacterium]
MKSTFRGVLAILAVFATASSAQAEKTSKLIELRVGTDRHQGRVLTRDSRNVLLLDRSGQITKLPLEKIKSFRTVSPQFAPLTPTMLNSALLRELGSGFQVKTTRHYVVAAGRGRAQRYVELFEGIYRAFHMHFSVRGFEIDRPEFPMVAIVFPSHASFARYAKKDAVDAKPGLMGYYMPTTNRVALFERGGDSGNASFSGGLRSFGGRGTPRWTQPENWLKPSSPHAEFPASKPALSILSRPVGSIQADLRDTMIHEATHQVAFNVGLHSRMRDNPQWVVEGLATAFEPDGMRDSAKGRSVKHRLNRERYVWFQNFAGKRRKDNSLADFVENDDLFKKSTLDAYSQAWALSFFLIETRPRKYATYLKRLAAGTGEDRGKLFREVFGSNTRMLEAEMLRFFKRLK